MHYIKLDDEDLHMAIDRYVHWYENDVASLNQKEKRAEG